MKRVLIFFIGLLLIFNNAFALEGLLNGSTWKGINNLAVSKQEKHLLKSLLVKEAFESHIFAKTVNFNYAMNKVNINKIDLSQYNIIINDYIRQLDKFYSVQDNFNFPLFFAVKLVDMLLYGESPAEIDAFKSAIKKQVDRIK